MKRQPVPLWDLNVSELHRHNIEAHGREEVNRMLREGWILLHIHTLHYDDNGIRRERPMAILGKPEPGARLLSYRPSTGMSLCTRPSASACNVSSRRSAAGRRRQPH
jgi:hypothetical protein